jgi:radical SAM superfamily enzyme YgiQ (UPF0313 family)
MFFNNEFFLPEFKPLIKCIKKYQIPIIVGGSGFSAMSNEILDYLQADYGIIGPGEIMFSRFLEMFKANMVTQRIFNGWEAGIDKEASNLRGSHVNYPLYTNNGAIIGFVTHYGCTNQCPYCVEANTPVNYRDISSVIEELTHLVQQGYNHFHTCDTEFNTNLDYSTNFCRTLIERNLKMKWALYMKPTPYNEEIFELLHKSKAYLITLTVDSDERIQKINSYNYNDLTKIIKYCQKYEIQLAIDLLVGYPYESMESVRTMINFFKINRPSTVGISFNYRIYNHTPLATLIKNDSSLQKNLNKLYTPDENFVKPIFFSQISQNVIKEFIENDKLFKIAGVTPGVNYQQI